jgi:hypothetical protein
MRSAWDILSESEHEDNSIWGPHQKRPLRMQLQTPTQQPQGELKAITRAFAKQIVQIIEIATDSHGECHVDLKTIDTLLLDYREQSKNKK